MANSDQSHSIAGIQTPVPDVTRIRPWGTVTLLEEGKNYRINRIELAPGQHISTQMHFHRSEHWVVVSGTAKVIFDDHETILIQKQSTYVPMCTPHRVENPGVIPLVMIEVQNGEYLGEDDITRLEEAPDAKNQQLVSSNGTHQHF
ncbi:MAG: phosphomannose isomerase type II C-terminal cupin domain [Leptolyngbyaceae cyanobacterium bins.349]|nr:phosphomannose isomerase type II C-terminal cupin domain [Leptolyngbyaceae cyanobacterium bins.349]